MDFDSSSKFISSLAKFLQSLCNGYVEFNNGVEVIGHIYINVDTGKKIDYVLNEKVCKTDENSVTFISNSFHAQPAEKPKQPEKPKTADIEETPEGSQDEIVIMDEPESDFSDNIGTLPPHQHHHKSSRPSKRPHHQSLSSHRHQSKLSRTDQKGHNEASHNTNSFHPANNSSKLLGPPLHGNSVLAAPTEADMSHLSTVFPQSFNDPSNSQHTNEERDVKPQLDSELGVVNVKQEYDTSQGGEGDQEGYDDSHGGAFAGMPYDQYYGDGSHRGQDYGPITGAAQGDFYQSGAGDCKSGDSTGRDICLLLDDGSAKWARRYYCPVPGCQLKSSKGVGFKETELKRHWAEKHEEHVLVHHCSVCSFSAKRKGNILRHFKVVHRQLSFQVGPQKWSINKEFIPPGQFTLNGALGKET